MEWIAVLAFALCAAYLIYDKVIKPRSAKPVEQPETFSSARPDSRPADYTPRTEIETFATSRPEYLPPAAYTPRMPTPPLVTREPVPPRLPMSSHAGIPAPHRTADFQPAGPAWGSSAPRYQPGRQVIHEGRTYTVADNGRDFRDSSGNTVMNSILIGALSGVAASMLYDAFRPRPAAATAHEVAGAPFTGVPTFPDNVSPMTRSPSSPVLPDADVSSDFVGAAPAPRGIPDVDVSAPLAPSAWDRPTQTETVSDADVSDYRSSRIDDTDVSNTTSDQRDTDYSAPAAYEPSRDTDYSSSDTSSDTGSVDVSE